MRRGGASGSLSSLAFFFLGVVPRVVFPVCFSFVCSRFLPGVVSRVVVGAVGGSRRLFRLAVFGLVSVGCSGFRSGRRRRFVCWCLRRGSVGGFPSVSSSVVGSRWLASCSVVVGLVRVSALVSLPVVVCSGVVGSRLASVGRLGVGCSGCCPSAVGRVVVRVGSCPLCPGWFGLVSSVRACWRGRRGKPAALFRERRNKKMTIKEKMKKQEKIVKQENAKLQELQEENRNEEYKNYLEREKRFKIAFPNAEYFEIDGRVYMSYSIWRRHVAPFRAAYPHKSYYPTLSEFNEYRYLAHADGYAYYGYGNNAIDYRQQWIHLLDDLRRQAGLRPLNAHEEEESLDKGCIICYD